MVFFKRSSSPKITLGAPIVAGFWSLIFETKISRLRLDCGIVVFFPKLEWTPSAVFAVWSQYVRSVVSRKVVHT